MKTTKLIAFLLLILLIWLSFYKDDVTPDYLNTKNAYFLDPSFIPANEESHALFWMIAIAYSLLFVIIPSFIVRFWFHSKLGLFTFIFLAGILILEYVLALSGIPTLSIHILPKINRYFHSPILTLFFIALFTLNNRNNEPAKPIV